MTARGFVPSLAIVAMLVLPVDAQEGHAPPSLRRFTLTEALAYAADHYPAVKVAVEQVTASSAGVSVAKAAWLPRLDAIWQSNRATVNNVTGLLLPQSTLPSLSGPPQLDDSSQSVWGSATGALLSWEPFDFGLRSAGVRSAEASVARARADEGLTRLEVERAVATAYLAVAHAKEAVRAAEADAERRAALARTARTLADNQLRPGAEASRADAERAAADTRAILARRAIAISEAEFARVLGLGDGGATVDATEVLSAPAAPPASRAEEAAVHPLLQVRQAWVDAARAQEEVLADTFRPRLFLQSAFSARGSGATYNGKLEGGSAGLWLDRANWAAGVQVQLPNPFDLPGLHAKQAASAALTRAETARYDEARLALASERQAAAAMVDAARAVAANTPVQLAAARQSEAQARARYDAGLAGIVEIADAQSLLAQAEYLDATARVDLWQALLADAVARGDLAPFVALAAGAGGGR